MDKKIFVEAPGYWSHKGTYTVELVEGSGTSIVRDIPDNEINGNIVTIRNGSLGKTIGGISMEDSHGNPFYWGYKFIKCIKKEDGSFLWINRNYLDD